MTEEREEKAEEKKPEEKASEDKTKTGKTPEEKAVKEKAAGDKSPEESPEESKDPSALEADTPLPPADFSSFILTLSTSALMHLGEVADPTTGEATKNVPMAKHAIDLIEILKEKTEGNLTDSESALIENVLHELRMVYVKKAG